MADLEQVSEALARAVTGFINDAGPAPCPIAVVAGWPTDNDLDGAMKSGGAVVSVYPPAGAAANVTRHQWDWRPVPGSAVIKTTAVIANGAITFGGQIVYPLRVVVRNNGRDTAYLAANGDTLATIAAQLAAAYGPMAAAAGAILTLTDAAPDLDVRFGTKGTLIRENAREKPTFQLTVWAASREKRIAVSQAFEGALMGTDALPLPDGTEANVFFQRSMTSDQRERDGIYRRDLWFQVEYAVTETEDAWTVVSASLQIEPRTSP